MYTLEPKCTQEGGDHSENFTKSVVNQKPFYLCIFLNFSPVGHNSAPSFMSKLWGGLTPRIDEIYSPKIFCGGSRPITVTSWQESEISCKI